MCTVFCMYGLSLRICGNEVVSAKGSASGNLVAFPGVARHGCSTYVSVIVDFDGDCSICFISESLDLFRVEMKLSVVCVKNFIRCIQFELFKNQDPIT